MRRTRAAAEAGPIKPMRLFDILRAALILAVLAAAVEMLSRAEHLEGRAEAVDGDTLDIAGTHIRLSGIDAPELRQTCERDGRAWRCGEAARAALEEALAGGTVSCRAEKRDKYRRPLALCTVSGTDLSSLMVRQGLAVAYLGNAYQSEEATARAARRGLWAGSFQRPADYRAEHPRGP